MTVGSTVDVTLGEGGAVAWVAQRSYADPPELGSLAVGSSFVYWRDGGRP